jgi:transcriptional regulator with XRE-family HTH domain
MKTKSMRQTAKELEISPAYLSMILSGQRNPNTYLRDKLCSQGMFTGEANFEPHNPKVVGSNPTPATDFCS